ncbi:MAG: DUF4886 domain-containing protein [Clostridia bacterium]|nr:DUF4886 domain-containing protein [Clostridia bacterium]
MNRRAISILAVLAMLCTMFTFAMPATAEATELALNFPKYADHANHPDQKEWLIQDAADWKAMMATADATAVGEEYFSGHTFHLTADVDFSQTEWLPPMGEGRYFGGTINGHGFGFNELKIYEGDGVFDASYNHKDAEGTGMFQRLGNCTFIDFGVNSGCVHRATGGVRTSVTTFGSLKNGYKPTFTRVWSGMELRHVNTGSVSALAVPADAAYNEDITVNGYVFDGKISTNRRNAFSLIGCIEGETRVITGGLKLTNIITDAQMYTNTRSPQHPQLNGENSLAAGAVSAPGETIATAYYSSLFSSNANTQMNEAIVENIYTVSYPNVVSYFGRGGDTRTIDKRMVTESALEAAWTANKNPSQSAAEPVFFTLKNGKIRPTAESKNMIVKVTLTGIKDKVYYLNANTTYDLAETFGKNDQQTFKINAETVTALVLGSEDVTIEVTTDCTHNGYTVTEGENANEHIRRCAICGYDKVETCSAQQNCTVNAITEEQLAAGEMATHSGTCDFCGEAFTVACAVDYVLSAKANKEAHWDYSACPCGRENVEHTNTAPVLSGDATGDDKIDLLDAVRILKKSVQSGEVEKERNADVDGDNAIQPLDALLAIRIWFGNKEAIKQADATAARINAENLFNSKDVTKQSLKMDGTEGDVAGYVVSDPIAVQKGEKLAFGPVRLTAPVIGYFYDAEGNPLQLINHTNVKVEYTFEEGKALVSIDVPADAGSVRFQMATEEADQFYLRLNTAITGMDYEERFEGETIENPLKGRTFLTVGDSLCAASNDPRIDGLRGWAQRIRDTFGAVVTNSAKGGSSLSTDAMTTDDDTGRYIFNQLIQHNGTKNFDYILLEGGVNDSNSSLNAPIGTFLPKTDPNAYDPAYFDTAETMAGGMEKLIYNTIKEHGDTAAIGYMTLYEMPHASGFSNSRGHLEAAKEICEKWGIEYLDLLELLPEEKFDTQDLTSDNVHAIAEGYDIMQTYINEFVPQMRPISQEIYNKVHEDKGFDKTEDGGPLNTAEENPYKDSLKILAIGNSFSQDATVYFWGIANSYGVENVVVENLSIGGCSLDTHYENITNNNAAYGYYKWTSANGGVSVNGENKSIAEALAEEDWDIITLQQASGENLVFSTEDATKYDPTAGEPIDTYSKLDEIIAYLQENKPNAKILWHMTWAYGIGSTHKAFAAYGNDQMVMYNSLLDRAQELTETHNALEGVLPSGAAIQNLRGFALLDSAKSGTTITRDGYHLNKGIGRYTAALTWYCYITGADPREVNCIPDNEYATDIETYRSAIAESVYNAIRNPYNK